MRKYCRGIVCALVVVFTFTLSAGIARSEPLTTAFTYQGQLQQGGTALTGNADFQFSLYPQLAGGTQVGVTLSLGNVTVTNGVFASLLDFGVNVFNGEARYLEIAVRSPAGSGSYTTLSPRVALTPTPYALQTRGIFVDELENVSIGSATPPSPANLSASSGGPAKDKFKTWAHEPGDNAVAGENTATTGDGSGMHGKSASSQGVGIKGEATATSGDAKGMHGKSASSQGTGIMGEASATTGDAKGMHGKSDADQGTGILGEASAATGATKGMHGKSASSNGVGMMGEASATTGDAKGMHGKSASSQGTGIMGEASATTGDAKGMHGKSDSDQGTGILGEAAAASGATKGMHGKSASSAGTGILGEATAATGDAKGMHGKSSSDQGTGILGEASAVTGATKGMHGKSASSAGTGILGEATSATGSAHGVRGSSAAAQGRGVVGTSAGGPLSAGVEGASPGGLGVLGTGATGLRGEGAGSGVLGVARTIGGSATVGYLGTAEPVLDGATAVHGIAEGVSFPGQSVYGVRGRSASAPSSSAGVLAEGDGINGSGSPRAAALNIRNGALAVSGPIRPAGSLPISETVTWSAITSCVNGGPGSHTHVIGHRTVVTLLNPLITSTSLVLLTVKSGAGDDELSYFAHIIGQPGVAGDIQIAITAMAPNPSNGCPPPSAESLSLNYLVINEMNP